MMYSGLLCVLALVLCLGSVGGQSPTNPGINNQNEGCQYGILPIYQYTIYISPDDPSLTTFLFYGEGTCGANSYAQVELEVAGTTYSCGYYDLHQQGIHGACPYPAGAGIEGTYTFIVPNLGPDFEGYFTYSVTHSQATSTAPAPTSTFTTTPTAITTSNVTTTQTDTATSSQITITTPSSTATNTITITPSVTVTTTTTTTFTALQKFQTYTVVHTTVTSTAACRGVSACPVRSRKKKARDVDGRLDLGAALERRATGADYYDDGPLTTTTTPALVVVTTAAPTTTQTVTSTTNAPDVTTTVANPTPTATVYSGVSVVSTTTTLPTKTRTKTRIALTVVRTTTTKTHTCANCHYYTCLWALGSNALGRP